MKKHASLGATLRAARLKKSLTLREVAAKLGTSHVSVLFWEQGRSIPRIKSLGKVSEVYGMKLQDVLDIIFDQG